MPPRVTHAIVDRSVDTITRRAFSNRRHLVSIAMHDGVKIIEEEALYGCESLKSIKLPGIKVIENRAFSDCTALEEVEFGDNLEAIEYQAFFGCRALENIEFIGVKLESIDPGVFAYCTALRRIKLSGVEHIKQHAFDNCTALEEVEFGETLKFIDQQAFLHCTSIRNIKLSKVLIIGDYAFSECRQLTDVELSEDLEAIGGGSGYGGTFENCRSLRRIAIPLKDDLLNGPGAFCGCDNLSQVDLVGGIHKAIASLHLESWRIAMNEEVDRINQDLPNLGAEDYETPNNKTAAIEDWLGRVLQRIEHYTSEHYALLKEAITLLELAAWKANLIKEDNGYSLEEKQLVVKRAKLDEECGDTSTKAIVIDVKGKIDANAARQAARVTCGADIIIKNVLPFLNDNEVFSSFLNRDEDAYDDDYDDE